jgi:hypothetical protein
MFLKVIILSAIFYVPKIGPQDLAGEGKCRCNKTRDESQTEEYFRVVVNMFPIVFANLLLASNSKSLLAIHASPLSIMNLHPIYLCCYFSYSLIFASVCIP